MIGKKNQIKYCFDSAIFANIWLEMPPNNGKKTKTEFFLENSLIYFKGENFFVYFIPSYSTIIPGSFQSFLYAFSTCNEFKFWSYFTSFFFFFSHTNAAPGNTIYTHTHTYTRKKFFYSLISNWSGWSFDSLSFSFIGV